MGGSLEINNTLYVIKHGAVVQCKLPFSYRNRRLDIDIGD